MFNLSPLPFSLMLLEYHRNQVAIEISSLAVEDNHVTNFFLHDVSSYIQFLNVIRELDRQRRKLKSN